ncbi:MAG: hypothetical protein AMS20_15910 [Gemmatimonas sp. SG8_28]|nr:MAG: hypothetical protein AMS20_15910 [Gemmatimonas sp. SG8_28]
MQGEVLQELFMRVHATVLLTVCGLACSTVTEPRLGDEFQLRVGEHAGLSDIGLWVAFLGVGRDSRCPLKVMCVWAGDAAVLVETAPHVDFRSTDSKTDTLHTNLDPKWLDFGSFELVLVRLDPYPETPSSISPDEYVATFLVVEPRQWPVEVPQ